MMQPRPVILYVNKSIVDVRQTLHVDRIGTDQASESPHISNNNRFGFRFAKVGRQDDRCAAKQKAYIVNDLFHFIEF